MARRLQLRRGTTSQNDAFTGAIGELTMDTQKKQIRLHDGSTLGGCSLIDPVVAFQVPTADNGYTWYRKYASGWVEQGGAQNGYDSINGNVMTKNLMIAMQTPYNATLTAGLGQSDTGAYWARMINESDSTHLKYYMYLNNSVTTNNPLLIWEVHGMAA